MTIKPGYNLVSAEEMSMGVSEMMGQVQMEQAAQMAANIPQPPDVEPREGQAMGAVPAGEHMLWALSQLHHQKLRWGFWRLLWFCISVSTMLESKHCRRKYNHIFEDCRHIGRVLDLGYKPHLRQYFLWNSLCRKDRCKDMRRLVPAQNLFQWQSLLLQMVQRLEVRNPWKCGHSILVMPKIMAIGS